MSNLGSPSDDLAAELAALAFVRAATAPRAYIALRLAVDEEGVTAGEFRRELGSRGEEVRASNAQRVLDHLADAGLLVRDDDARPRRYSASPSGVRVREAIALVAGSSAVAATLGRRRALAVGVGDSDPAAVAADLESVADLVVNADGDFDFLALLPDGAVDDVKAIAHRLRQRGCRTYTARVAGAR